MNFLPSAAAGMSEDEWNLFCRFYDRKHKLNQSDLEVFDILDKIHDMRDDGTLETVLLEEFQIYCIEKNISINEGLTHPNEWIRTFSKQLAGKDR